MVIQYPHTLYSISVGTSLQGTNGDWETDSPNGIEYTEISRCREEPNGGGATINLPDGTVHQFASMIYLPKQIITMTAGQFIQVRDRDGNVIYSGDIKRISIGQLNCRIWS